MVSAKRVNMFIASLTAAFTLAAPASAQVGNSVRDQNYPAGEPICSKGRWAQSSADTVGGLIVEGLFKAASKRACYAHIATQSEMEQILRHPIFNPGDPSFLGAVSRAAKKRAAEGGAAFRKSVAGSIFSGWGSLIAMSETDQAGRDFGLTYQDIEEFVKAQPPSRAQNGILPTQNMREDVLEFGKNVFTVSYRHRVDVLQGLGRESVLQFLTGTNATLGSKLSDCISKKESVTTSSLDGNGNLRTNVSQKDVTAKSCADQVTDALFIRLITIREWHPYLWSKLSETYAKWLAVIPASQRMRYAAPPPPIAVTQ